MIAAIVKFDHDTNSVRVDFSEEVQLTLEEKSKLERVVNRFMFEPMTEATRRDMRKAIEQFINEMKWESQVSRITSIKIDSIRYPG